MNDIERLLNDTFPFVESLLKTHGEFFPVASAIKTDGNIVQIGTHNGNDRPLSDKLIKDFKIAFKSKQDDYSSITIFYDVSVVNPDTEQKTDAIAVFVETKHDNDAYTFYFPYLLTESRELEFSNSWKNLIPKEIFNS